MAVESHTPLTPDVPKVVAVILHFNDLSHTTRCVESLKQLDYPDLHTVVVNNSGEEEHSKRLDQRFAGDITCLTMDRNRGFSGGCNAGIGHALSHGADYIWLLNNDAYCQPDSLQPLVSAAVAHPDAGVVGGVLLEPKRNGMEQAGLGYIDYWRAKIFTREPRSSEVQTCDWVCGGNMLLRAQAIIECGAFDDAYFLYKEDVELCTRLQRHGYKCLYVPASKVHHSSSMSTAGERAIWRHYYSARNRLLFFSQSASRPLFFWCLLVCCFQLIRHLTAYPFASEKKRIKTLGEYLGLIDFLGGNFGQRRFG
jgi:GT2 family glycosyltransferase